MTSAYTGVRKLPPQPTQRQIVDAVNALIDQTVQSSGPLSLNVKTITNAGSPYTVIATDQFLLADTSSGNVTFNLPAIATSDGRDLIAMKSTLDNNNVVLDANASETINGSTTKTIQGQYSGLHIRCDASVGWLIVGFF